MTLELNRLTETVEEMGQTLAHREGHFTRLVEKGREWMANLAGRELELQGAARRAGAAIPTEERVDATFPLPSLPEQFTVIGADGSQIHPDRHGMALYYLINIGSLVYRHGSGQTPEAYSVPRLYYREEDLYEGPLLVAGNLLDIRRDQSEIQYLAERVKAEASEEGHLPTPTLALVDGTLLLWVLENLSAGGRERRVRRYLAQLDQIRAPGAAVAAFTSRPRYTDVGKLLHLDQLEGDAQRARTEPNPLERIPDRAIFSFLPPGDRSPLFASPSDINPRYYVPEGQGIHFFYVNVAEEEEPVIARVEVPAWVVRGTAGTGLLDLVHGGVVAQSRIAGGFPYVLARADELAYISGPERERLEEMVATSLLAAGVSQTLSPKAYYKSLTRQGRRW